MLSSLTFSVIVVLSYESGILENPKVSNIFIK